MVLLLTPRFSLRNILKFCSSIFCAVNLHIQLFHNPLELQLYNFRIRDDSKRYVLHHFEIVFFHQHSY